MRQLCAGIVDCGNSVWSIPTHPACTDATAAGHLAAALLTRHMETASTSSTSAASSSSCRHVVFPHVTDLRAALLAPNLVAGALPSPGAAAVPAAEKSRVQSEQESGDFHDLGSAGKKPSPSAATAPVNPSFVADTVSALTSEAALYARGEDKLCATAAFVFHLIPSAAGSDHHHVALWAMCHIAADTIQHAGQRAFELTCAAHVLARWGEVCMGATPEMGGGSPAAASFALLCRTPPGQSAGVSSRFAVADGVLGWAAAALEETMGDFGDARHASREPSLRE